MSETLTPTDDVLWRLCRKKPPHTRKIIRRDRAATLRWAAERMTPWCGGKEYLLSLADLVERGEI